MGLLYFPGLATQRDRSPTATARRQKSWGGHPSCDGTADYFHSGTGSVVTRHRAMADEKDITLSRCGAT